MIKFILLGAVSAVNLVDDGDYDFYSAGNNAEKSQETEAAAETNTQVESDDKKPAKLGLFNASAVFDAPTLDKFSQKSDVLA